LGNSSWLDDLLFQHGEQTTMSKFDYSYPESGKHENVALGVVESHVPRPRAEIEHWLTFLVEDGGLGGHVAVHDAELMRGGGPNEVINGSVFGQLNHGGLSLDVEVVQLRFAVVRGARLVDFGLSVQDD